MKAVVFLTNLPNPEQHPLFRALQQIPNITIEATDRAARLTELSATDVVVTLIDPTLAHHPFEEREEAALVAHLRQGGGLVAVGASSATWQGTATLRAALGIADGRPTPQCEIIAETTTAHPLTRRLPSDFIVVDAPLLLSDLPADALPLLRTTWQSQTFTLAYLRPVGAGQAIVLTLGGAPLAWDAPTLSQFVTRAVGAVAGQREGAAINVAMIGYGAIGREHGEAISQVEGLHYALVCDTNPARLADAQAAFPGVRTSLDLAEIGTDDAIDAVIISTPPNSHARIAAAMLRAGKHVILEKPFCLTGAEADELITLAADHQRALTVYQCRRWDADYLAIQQTIAAGAIGEPFHLEAFIGGFEHPCHYWHSDAAISGGAIYDWGSHYLDWMLQLVPDRVTSVRGTEHKRVWHDVTNADQTHVHLQFAGGQEADLLQSDIAAALKPKWYILGTRGAIVAQWRHMSVATRTWSGALNEDRLAPSEALPTVTVHERDGRGLVHARELTLPSAPLHAFHRNFADHLHNGTALAVTPASARRNVHIMEAVRRSAAQGGVTIPIEE
ncbi:MAG: Gfo/Idh/MocA family oxidoreductase [Ktedonobacterales bacterium]|nr:Gfo/Idh/MocA family oxidoreductase [Ktedonobacterales bacterium]